MNIIYSDQLIPEDTGWNSIFLAGPTPRDLVTPSWRPNALEILHEFNYNGTVFVPEHEIKKGYVDYDAQVEWEDEGLYRAKWKLFWIPRNLITMPAFTTNVEFGRFVAFNRCIYGRPDDAPKTRYLDWLYKKYNKNYPIFNNLKDLLKQAIQD